MKRTAEIVLSVLGALANAAGAVIALLLVLLFRTEEVRNEFAAGFNEEMINEGIEESIDAFALLNLLLGMGWFLVILGVLGTISGIIAIIWFKGNAKPKAAGIILIISSIVILIGTVGFGFIPFLLYLIAGILALVRKPSVVEEPILNETIDMPN